MSAFNKTLLLLLLVNESQKWKILCIKENDKNVQNWTKFADGAGQTQVKLLYWVIAPCFVIVLLFILSTKLDPIINVDFPNVISQFYTYSSHFLQ